VTYEATPNGESPERKEGNGTSEPVPGGTDHGDPLGKPTSARRKEEKKKEKKKEKKEKKKEKKKKKGGAGRGVETMFRTAYRTHLDLSSLADTKANIMISINGIIISILLATVYPSLVQNRALFLPSSLLVLTCLASLVLAVLAARPRVTRKTVTPEDVRENRANILFFGNFINMKEQDFLDGMWELMEDRERTYTTMMRDLYGLGSVLGAKYRLLRTSYTVFVVGLAVGVIAFLAVYASSGGANGGP
jgi:hypothetical protein